MNEEHVTLIGVGRTSCFSETLNLCIQAGDVTMAKVHTRWDITLHTHA